MNLNHVIAVIGLATGMASPAVLAATDNLAADWSTTDNPNGPWSYLHGTALLPAQPTSCCGMGGGPSFAPSYVPGTFLPIFLKGPSADSDVSLHTWDPFNGQAALGEAVLAWTAPITGVADVSGYFYYAQFTHQRSNDVTVRLGTTVLGSAVLSYLVHQDAANRWDFSFDNVAISAGDILTFTFVRSAGQSAGSAVSGNVIISSVPEPQSYVLMFAGLGFFAFLARRSKQ